MLLTLHADATGNDALDHRQLRHLDRLTIDADGQGWAVVQGAIATIAVTHPTVIVHGDDPRIVAHLTRWGYHDPTECGGWWIFAPKQRRVKP